MRDGPQRTPRAVLLAGPRSAQGRLAGTWRADGTFLSRLQGGPALPTACNPPGSAFPTGACFIPFRVKGFWFGIVPNGTKQ